MVLACLPLAAPIGLSPLYIPTLCGSEHILVVSMEPLDDLSGWSLRTIFLYTTLMSLGGGGGSKQQQHQQAVSSSKRVKLFVQTLSQKLRIQVA